MEFDKSRCFTSLNADELKAGDKVIVGSSLLELKTNVECNRRCGNIVEIGGECSNRRFTVDDVDGRGQTYWELAYLVERKENCTNCIENDRGCTAMGNDKLAHCWNWKPITKQKAEPHYRPFTIKEAKEYILQNWFDGAEDVEAAIPFDPEYKAMKIAVEVLELAEKINEVRE